MARATISRTAGAALILWLTSATTLTAQATATNGRPRPAAHASSGADGGRVPWPAAAEGSLSLEQRVYGLSLLWQETNYNFAFFDGVRGLDWDSAYRVFLPRVAAAPTTLAYYRELQRFVALLKDGHTRVYLPDSIRARRPYDAPRVLLREVQHRAFVENVDSTLAPELPPGSEIVAVNGVPVPTLLRDSVFPLISSSTEHVLWREAIRGNTALGYGLLVGPAGTEVSLDFVRPDGASGSLALRRDGFSSPARWAVRALPYRLVGLDWRETVPILTVNSFNEDSLLPALDRLLSQVRDAPALVLDIRGNGGGRDDVVRQVLDRFLDAPALGPAWRTRVYNAAYSAWGHLAQTNDGLAQYRPYAQRDAWLTAAPDTFTPTAREKYAGRVLVLIGDRTQSAAENFLVYLHGQARFTLLGRPTMGTTGQPLFLDLPGGGKAWIVTKRNTYPDGRTYVGTGVLPDVPVEPTPDDLRAGRDRALERAVQLARGR